MELPIMRLYPPSCYSLHVGPNILLSTLFSNSLYVMFLPYEEKFNFTPLQNIIIIIISGSTVFVAASHRRFRDLIKTLGSIPLDE
jgi:hypothetical protein